MSEATITLIDEGDEIRLKIDFSEGINDESHAHYLATKAFEFLIEQNKGANND